MIKVAVALLLVLSLACGKAASNAPSLNQGAHPATWIADHRDAYVADPNQCLPCHGSPTDPATAGGIAKVSCFSTSWEGQACHINGHGPAGHPSNWVQPTQHGLLGAMATPSSTKGFTYCITCHTYAAGGTAFTDQSCLTCHTKAPHPDAPWLSTTLTHASTDPGNVGECAKCHTNRANAPGLTPVVPPPTGAPGCFNNTLCHAAAQHPTGWDAAAQHGLLGAMAATSSTTGFAYCRTCHTYDGTGTSTTTTTCVTCHTKAPHPDKPWHGAVLDHTLTNQGNISECAKCHTNGANSDVVPTSPAPGGTAPGCFNSTLCHDAGAAAPHVTGTAYLAAGLHGPDAKANLASCQVCHATPPSGSEPRFNKVMPNMASGCETCHDVYTAHPIPWVPGRGTTQGVTNTKTHATAGNLSTTCVLCHGANLTGGTHAPSCMSSGLNDGAMCHTTNPVTTPTGCTSCHGTPPSGSAAPNRAESHPTHVYTGVVCAACHNGSGTGTTTHANGSQHVAFGIAYQAKTGGSPTFSSTALTCTNVSCHGGQTTPAWNTTGQINVATDCTKCHSGSGQYNSYSTASARSHHSGTSCTSCHAMSNGLPGSLNHFAHLDTSAMEGPASDTIAPNGVRSRYNPTNHTCNNISCHETSGTYNW